MILRNISLEDEDTNFSPRVIAHRGLSGLCPENTLPAFGAAVALGVHEIEFDIWGSKDRELVICHDPNVNRTSNGEGSIKDLNWEDIKKLDAGSWFDARWANITFCRMEDICEQYAGKVTMNIHIKDPGEEGWVVEKSRDLIKKYNIEKRTYFAGEKDVLEYALIKAPEIERCCLEGQRDMTIVDNAIKYNCRRVQFWYKRFNQELIDKAHKHDIICNLFYCDVYEDAKKLYAMGIDAILSNYANITLPAARVR